MEISIGFASLPGTCPETREGLDIDFVVASRQKFVMAFLVFEGLDGSGKSTLINMVAKLLEDKGIAFVQTREPGGTPLGEELRQVLLRREGDPPCPRAELLLYEAIRAQHVDRVIRPSLDSGKWVLCDRFTASTLAFQAKGRGVERRSIEWLNGFASGGLLPDLNVLVHVSVATSLQRLNRRESGAGQGLDRFESERRDFHERVREGYLEEYQRDPKSWLLLDGEKSPAELLSELIEAFKERRWLAS